MNGAAEPGLVAKAVPGDNSEPISITEISARLKRTVEDGFGHVRLRGELSGVKRAASGHLYCCLKDEGARIDGVMWRGAAQRLAFLAEDGIEVVASGKLTTYPGRSNYQIVIDRMEIAGEGALLALLEKTKARLAAEGLFDPARKRALPYLPAVIGVVTSPTGAVIRDILHRLSDRFPVRVLVWPVNVQGQGAADQIAAAVEGFSHMPGTADLPRPDLVIVARGGGSIEDLWAFNEEVVVRAIAACPIPLISAVGHETDTTLADFAADLRAPTPTAAAELAVPVRAELSVLLADLGLRQRKCVSRPVTLGRERLAVRAQRLPTVQALLAAPIQRLDDLAERARRGLGEGIAIARTRLQRDAGRLSAPLLRARAERARERLAALRLSPALLAREIAGARERLEAQSRMLDQLGPASVLKRGYAIVRGGAGQTITTAESARTEPRLSIQFADASLEVSTGTVPAPRTARLSARTDRPAPAQGKLL